MKKILLSFSTLFLASMMLVSCSKNSPKDVANSWLTSFYHMDYEAAKKVSTEDTKALLTQLGALSSMMPDSLKKEAKNIAITISDVKEDGDKATVTYKKSDKGKDATPSEASTLKLVKKDGKWLVQFTKNDQMGSGSDAAPSSPDQGTTPPADAGNPAGSTDTTQH